MNVQHGTKILHNKCISSKYILFRRNIFSMAILKKTISILDIFNFFVDCYRQVQVIKSVNCTINI